jgi:hypothetical protein
MKLNVYGTIEWHGNPDKVEINLNMFHTLMLNWFDGEVNTINIVTVDKSAEG